MARMHISVYAVILPLSLTESYHMNTNQILNICELYYLVWNQRCPVHDQLVFLVII